MLQDIMDELQILPLVFNFDIYGFDIYTVHSLHELTTYIEFACTLLAFEWRDLRKRSEISVRIANLWAEI
jgi:hypothetical protein